MAADGRSPAVDEVLIAALTSGATYQEAGKVAGVSERTVRRRMRDPVFRGRVDRATADLARTIAARLIGQSLRALDRLSELLDEEDPRVRLGAIKLTLEAVLRHRDASILEDRLLALESTAQRETEAT